MILSNFYFILICRQNIINNFGTFLRLQLIHNTGNPITHKKMSSAAEDDVMRIRRKLENITEQLKEAGDQSDTGQALDLLKSLSDTKMNLQILTKTRIGMTVNALR